MVSAFDKLSATLDSYFFADSVSPFLSTPFTFGALKTSLRNLQRPLLSALSSYHQSFKTFTANYGSWTNLKKACMSFSSAALYKEIFAVFPTISFPGYVHATHLPRFLTILSKTTPVLSSSLPSPFSDSSHTCWPRHFLFFYAILRVLGTRFIAFS